MHQLGAQIWRRINQYPPASVDANRDAALGSLFKNSAARGITLATSTIPLRNSAPRSRP
jgi:hypothetical protein